MRRLAGFAVGGVFGATLSWSGMASPEVLRAGLLFQKSYLFLFFASAVATAFLGLRLVRRARTRAVLADTPIRWEVSAPGGRHVLGSLLFGVGWGIADVCPGPALAQLGQGIGWSLFTLAGMALGIRLFQRRRRAEPQSAQLAAQS